MLKKTLVVLMFPFFSYANELSVEQAKNMHEELNTDMRIMQEKMHAGMMSNDPDVAFAAGMLPHHLGAVESKRAARTVLTGMCYSVGSATRQGSSSPTRFIGQSAMTSRT
ncbi:hypothetical protein [Escherichia albertii]|uniref:hypothetical protein n=1 Tax=Escherichia albertii TaxID=208962 RepID=UPI00235F92E7|nr:hypothetical protein [Escherichia albertii]WDB92338.1 hypothetical protein PS050_19550 [Escherichia albertii]